jgi:hypothetical protein
MSRALGILVDAGLHKWGLAESSRSADLQSVSQVCNLLKATESGAHRNTALLLRRASCRLQIGDTAD